jgi:hypothetical protein
MMKQNIVLSSLFPPKWTGVVLSSFWHWLSGDKLTNSAVLESLEGWRETRGRLSDDCQKIVRRLLIDSVGFVGLQWFPLFSDFSWLHTDFLLAKSDYFLTGLDLFLVEPDSVLTKLDFSLTTTYREVPRKTLRYLCKIKPSCTQMDENSTEDVNFASIINKFQVYDIAS